MTGPGRPGRLLTTAPGTDPGPYTGRDWALVASVALMWGTANLLIAEALDTFEPGLVTWSRVSLGALTLAVFPAARTRIEREDRVRVAVVAVTWVALPFTLFPIAQQWIASSVAGMLIGSLPLFAAALAGVLLRRLPGPGQALGLIVGFAGVFAVGWPVLDGAGTTALGVVLVVVAVASYAVAVNISVPLVQRYGSVPVMARALALSAVLTAPFGVASVPASGFEAGALAAVVVLGVGASGIAFLAFTRLSARVGPTRAAAANYFVPVVALAAGVVWRDEHVEAASIVGVAMVLVGAWLVSRRDEPPGRLRPLRPARPPAPAART